MANKTQSQDPKPIRNDLQEKAPQRQKGDKLAGLQPDAQDAGDTRDPISKANK